MKRILFINLRSHYVERMEPLYAAKKLGVEVVLLADIKPQIDDGYISEDNFIITDTYDMANALQKVIEFAKDKPIDGVLTWSDRDVELVSLIAEKLDIPAPNIEASKNARNKFLMRKAISEENPELCPKFLRVTNLSEFKEAVDVIGTPGVLKPVGASGSKTIVKIYSETNLESIFERVRSETRISRDKVYKYFPDEYIYEELLSGDEMSVEGFVSSVTGEVVIAGMTDKYVTDEYSTEYKEIEPSQKSPKFLKLYSEKVKSAVKSLGLTACAFHAEVKVVGETLKVIEIAARPGGGFITTHLVKLASGVSFIEETIKNALNQPIDKKILFESWSQSPKYVVGQEDFMSEKEGEVSRVGGLPEIFEDSNVRLFIPLKEVGDEVILPPKNYGSLYTGRIIVAASNIKEVEKSLLRAKNKYRFEVK